MPQPGLQVSLKPHVTLTFGFLAPAFIVSRHCRVDNLCQFASKLVHSFSKYCVHKFGNGHKLSGRTNEQIGCEHYAMPPPTSLAWQRHREVVNTMPPHTCLSLAET